MAISRARSGPPPLPAGSRIGSGHRRVALQLRVSLHFPGDFQGVEKAFRKALAINDQNADAHGNLATTLEQLGRSGEAERHYRLALQNNPSHPMANFHLGRRLAERGRYRQAVPYLERAVATDSPGTALHGYLLAIVHRELGASERASEVARAAQQHARSRNQAQLAEKIAAEFRP
ncbi:MAG: tetratricopeptide repeat protein [Bryobacterales bacterium]|nr:tetratricopeptide repeat protein [Bryobacterales bacterium]